MCAPSNDRTARRLEIGALDYPAQTTVERIPSLPRSSVDPLVVIMLDPLQDAAMAPRRRRGRPAGSKTRRRPAVEVSPSACPACGSTSRTAYRLVRTVSQSGVIDGRRFNRIIRRRSRCTVYRTEREDVCREFILTEAEAKLALARAELRRRLADRAA